MPRTEPDHERPPHSLNHRLTRGLCGGVSLQPAHAMRLGLFLMGALITAAGFFLPAAPFALALLPLFAGLWSGARPLRFITMTSFMIWPVLLSGWGLHGVDPGRPDLIWPLAVGLILALGLLAALIGSAPTTALITLIPVFPASPLLPGLGVAGPLTLMILLALIERMRPHRLRKRMLATLATCLTAWAVGHGMISAHMTERSYAEDPVSHSEWRALPEPLAITERGRWIALRNQLPTGATLILGENVFAQDDTEALAFWCQAASTRGLTLYIGVEEPYRSNTRSAVWRLDPDSCNTVGRPPSRFGVHHARLGIPHLTGTWGVMRASRAQSQSAAPAPGIDWLICVEAFLPWAWASLLLDTAPDPAAHDPTAPPPIIILSNDQAFRPLPALGPPPVHILRRKSARAMAALSGRRILFAETGRTFLIHTPEEGNS